MRGRGRPPKNSPKGSPKKPEVRKVEAKTPTRTTRSSATSPSTPSRTKRDTPAKQVNGEKEQKASSEFKHKCLMCNKMLESAAALKKHQKKEHEDKVENEPDTGGPPTCSLCGKVCKNRTQLLHHKRDHYQYMIVDGNLSLVCSSCNEVFDAESDFEQHMRENHMQMECSNCKKQFDNTTSLLEHMHECQEEGEEEGEEAIEGGEEEEEEEEGEEEQAEEGEEEIEEGAEEMEAEQTMEEGEIAEGEEVEEEGEEEYEEEEGEEEYEEDEEMMSPEQRKDRKMFSCATCGALFNSAPAMDAHQQECDAQVYSDSDSDYGNGIPTDAPVTTGEDMPEGDKSTMVYDWIDDDTPVPMPKPSNEPKDYRCHVCGEDCGSIAKLAKHKDGHFKFQQKKKKYKLACMICPASFEDMAIFMDHLKGEHEKVGFDTVVQCDVCNIVLPNKERLKEHKRKVHRKGLNIRCKICWTVFPDNDLLLSHQKEGCVNAYSFMCPLCGKFTENIDKLVEHKEGHVRRHLFKGSIIFICTICEKGFDTMYNLKKHVRKNHGKFQCSICENTFGTKRYLIRHEMIIHQQAESHSCEVCGFTTGYVEYLKKHMESAHSDGVKHFCDVCGKGFNARHRLTLHKWIHREATVGCPICHKKFRNRRYMKKHMLCHTDEKPFACNLCDRIYKDQSALKIHIKRKHDPNPPTPKQGERQFPCPHCTHCAMTKEALRVHIYTHTGERHHVCTVCGNKFTQRASLNRHMATHTGEKRHKCPICEKRFIQKCSLDRHMDTHQGIKRYKCEVCGEQYSQSYPLSKHIKKKHPDYWKEFNEDRRYMPRNTPLQQRLSPKKGDLPSPIQLFEEPSEDQEEMHAEGKSNLVVEIDEPEVVPVIAMPNMTKMEKKKRTARKSMIQLKTAEDVMNLFEDVVMGPIEIAPIKGEKGADDEEEAGEVVNEEGIEGEEEGEEAAGEEGEEAMEDDQQPMETETVEAVIEATA